MITNRKPFFHPGSRVFISLLVYPGGINAGSLAPVALVRAALVPAPASEYLSGCPARQCDPYPGEPAAQPLGDPLPAPARRGPTPFGRDPCGQRRLAKSLLPVCLEPPAGRSILLPDARSPLGRGSLHPALPGKRSHLPRTTGSCTEHFTDDPAGRDMAHPDPFCVSVQAAR
jgi:hypothetical protein